jgi:hypothetical protein
MHVLLIDWAVFAGMVIAYTRKPRRALVRSELARSVPKPSPSLS